MRRRTMLVSAAYTAVAGLALSLSGLASAGSTAHTPVIVPWSYQAVAPSPGYTLTEAVNQAKGFSVIAANQNAYGASTAAMLAANPNLQLLAYVNGAYAQSTQGSAYPANWYLHSAGGAQVRSVGYGNYLMDVTNPAWISSVIQHCQQAMTKTHYVGCFIDMMGTASITAGYTNALPVDPATHLAFTNGQWLASTSALARQVKSALGASVPVYANGLGNGARYFDASAPSKQVLSGIDGALAESWLRSAPSALSWYPNETVWLANVNMVTDAAASGKGLLMTTKTWGSGTNAELQAWHVYALASYLMVANGKAAFSFLGSRTGDPTAVDTLEASLNLGDPTGAYAKVGGVYQRSFTTGKVLVNSTKYTVSVPLGGTYTNTAGTSMTSVTMAPNQAQILTAG